MRNMVRNDEGREREGEEVGEGEKKRGVEEWKELGRKTGGGGCGGKDGGVG